MRLDLPSGTSVRFEPGDVKEVQLSLTAASAWSTGSTAWSWAGWTTPTAQDEP